MADIFLSTPSARRATACVRVSRVRAYISIHALREEGDVRFNTAILLYVKFLSTPSARRATLGNTAALSVTTIFLSTPSARRATVRHGWNKPIPKYFYPRPPRGGRLANIGEQAILNKISIHALREEGDLWMTSKPSASRISIHALREEGDVKAFLKEKPIFLFLSTPSARRATDDDAP